MKFKWNKRFTPFAIFSILAVLVVLSLFSINSNASPFNPIQPNVTNNVPIAGAVAGAKASASVGNVDTGGNYSNIKFDQEKPAAAASPAASSNTTAQCRYLEQYAVGIVIATASGTKMLRDLVCTLGEELNPLQKLALCIESGDYREMRYYISTLPTKEGEISEGACPVGGDAPRVMSN